MRYPSAPVRVQTTNSPVTGTQWCRVWLSPPLTSLTSVSRAEIKERSRGLFYHTNSSFLSWSDGEKPSSEPTHTMSDISGIGLWPYEMHNIYDYETISNNNDSKLGTGELKSPARSLVRDILCWLAFIFGHS